MIVALVMELMSSDKNKDNSPPLAPPPSPPLLFLLLFLLLSFLSFLVPLPHLFAPLREDMVRNEPKLGQRPSPGTGHASPLIMDARPSELLFKPLFSIIFSEKNQCLLAWKVKSHPGKRKEGTLFFFLMSVFSGSNLDINIF